MTEFSTYVLLLDDSGVRASNAQSAASHRLITIYDAASLGHDVVTVASVRHNSLFARKSLGN